MSKTFSSTIGDWARQSKERTTAVYRRSVELLSEDMTNTIPNGGRVPFLDGNLARSLRASTVAMPRTVNGAPTARTVGAITATLRPEQPVWLGYQAVYARRQNYGFIGADSLGRVYNQTGHYFVEGAVAKWQGFVDQAVKEIKG